MIIDYKQRRKQRLPLREYLKDLTKEILLKEEIYNEEKDYENDLNQYIKRYQI